MFALFTVTSPVRVFADSAVAACAGCYAQTYTFLYRRYEQQPKQVSHRVTLVWCACMHRWQRVDAAAGQTPVAARAVGLIVTFGSLEASSERASAVGFVDQPVGCWICCFASVYWEHRSMGTRAWLVLRRKHACSSSVTKCV